MGATLRVYRCSCGVPHTEWPEGRDHDPYGPEPAELVRDADGFVRTWGGMYDPLLRKYVGPSLNPIELKCSPDSVRVLTRAGLDAYDRPLTADEILLILNLGAKGAGKTFDLVTGMVLDVLSNPNTTGGCFAPTVEGCGRIWETLEELGIPDDWHKKWRPSTKQMLWSNGVKVHVRGAQAPSQQAGSPLRGFSLQWARADEWQSWQAISKKDLMARGRRAGKKYRIFATASNERNPEFRMELETIRLNKHKRLIRSTGFANPWVDPDFWIKIRGTTDDREWREIYLAEDVAPERLTYSRFDMGKNVCPMGEIPAWVDDITRKKWGKLTDVTEEMVYDVLHVKGYKSILATDYGILVNCSEELRIYRTANNELLAWAISELTTTDGTDMHAYKLKQHYNPDECLVIADPHLNSKDTDKSDYKVTEGAGFTVIPAMNGKIPKKHRISMMQALLCDANKVRRLYVHCGKDGTPACPRLVQSFLTAENNDRGEFEKERKNGINDPSHWPSATGYGLYRYFKRFGYDSNAPTPTAKPQDDAWWKQQ